MSVVDRFQNLIIAAKENNIEFKENELLSKHTFYRIGGPARLMFSPQNISELEILSKEILEHELPYFILGAGSNLIVSDDGFDGVVIKTSRLNHEAKVVEYLDQKVLRLGSSLPIASVLRKAVQEGWGELEYWVGIPGTVGGAVFMNGGTHLGETCPHMLSVDVFSLVDGKIKTYVKEELLSKYRSNLFLKQGEIVYSVTHVFKKLEASAVKQSVENLLTRRKNNQPVEMPSCGSVFKNPKEHGLHAWQVIEKIGLRGHRVGDAEFSDKHCNFIVNHGKAKATEVLGLIDEAKRRAKEQLGIVLEEEVVKLGVKSI